MRRAVLSVLVVCAGCSGLEDLRLGMCGNGYIEPESGEDCDFSRFPGVPSSVCGLPDTVGACRFVCDATSCPPGYACGDDKVCRQPMMTFRLAGEPYRPIGGSFVVDDLDGDGRRDVVGTNRRGAVALFGRPGLELFDRQELITGPPIAPVVTASLETTARRDLVVPVGRGLQVAHVDETRTLRAVAHPAFQIDQITRGRDLRLLPLRLNGLYDALLALVDDDRRVAVVSNTAALPIPDAAIPDTQLDQILDPIGRGEVDGPPGGGTDEIAIVMKGADQVAVFGVTCAGAPNIEGCNPSNFRWELRDSVPLPNRATARLGAVLADADGDGYADLFTYVDGELYVALNQRRPGNRDGPFDGFVRDERLSNERCESCDEWPIAITDIDGDGAADLVTSTAVATTSSAGAQLRHVSSFGELSAWSFAAVADFDGDGRNDVAVAQLGRPGFELVLGSENLVYNAFFTETEDPVLGLHAGDFDGDGVGDLVVVGQRGDDNVVAVSYGAPRARLSEPVVMATFDNVERVEPAFLTGLAVQTFDFRHDLIIEVQTNGEPPIREIALLVGTPQQQLIAPVLLGTEPANVERPRAAVAGNFVSGGRGDVLALSNRSQWLMPSSNDGELSAALATRSDTAISLDDKADILMQAVNLDGDPEDEVVVFTGAYPGVPNDVDVEAQMYIVDVQSDGSLTTTKIELPVEIYAPTSLRVGRVGEDPNVAIIISYAGRQDGIVPGAGGVAVFSTNGSGRVSAEPKIARAMSGEIVLGASAANIDTTPQFEVIALLRERVAYLDASGDTLEWIGQLPLENDPRIPSAFATLRAEDIDGDGLVDLAIADERGFYVYRAVDVVQERRVP